MAVESADMEGPWKIGEGVTAYANGAVLAFDVTGTGSVAVAVRVMVDGEKIANPSVTGETTFDLGEDGEELEDLASAEEQGAIRQFAVAPRSFSPE